jgi:hypothetical protein
MNSTSYVSRVVRALIGVLALVIIFATIIAASVPAQGEASHPATLARLGGVDSVIQQAIAD